MESWDQISIEFSSGEILALLFLLIMPLTYALIGWFTNWLALKMTFYPLEFRGWKPCFGWQGIIPRKGYKMAGTYVDIITERLLTIEEVFARIDPVIMARQLVEHMQGSLARLVDQVGNQLYPRVWELSPDALRQSILERSGRESERAIARGFREIQHNIEKYFNIREFVFQNLTGPNIRFLVDMFQRVGGPEFRFIERCGLYFGALLGLIQMILWIYFPIWWTLPIQGALVGFLTNWLAIQMIFRPLQPIHLGPWSYQGLFLRRQSEVSQQFADLVAGRILTSSQIMSFILSGQAAQSIAAIIRHNAESVFGSQTSIARPVLYLSGEAVIYQKTREQILSQIETVILDAASHLTDYMDTAMDLKISMQNRMRKLPPVEFEYLLRTAFREDEWLLILVGAVLGALVGLAQALVSWYF